MLPISRDVKTHISRNIYMIRKRTRGLIAFIGRHENNLEGLNFIFQYFILSLSLSL